MITAEDRLSRDMRLNFRETVRAKVVHLIMCNPVNQLEANMVRLVDWIMTQVHTEKITMPSKILGLSPGQIEYLKFYYESKEGRKAEEILI